MGVDDARNKLGQSNDWDTRNLTNDEHRCLSRLHIVRGSEAVIGVRDHEGALISRSRSWPVVASTLAGSESESWGAERSRPPRFSASFLEHAHAALAGCASFDVETLHDRAYPRATLLDPLDRLQDVARDGEGEPRRPDPVDGGDDASGEAGLTDESEEPTRVSVPRYVGDSLSPFRIGRLGIAVADEHQDHLVVALGALVQSHQRVDIAGLLRVATHAAMDDHGDAQGRVLRVEVHDVMVAQRADGSDSCSDEKSWAQRSIPPSRAPCRVAAPQRSRPTHGEQKLAGRLVCTIGHVRRRAARKSVNGSMPFDARA